MRLFRALISFEDTRETHIRYLLRLLCQWTSVHFEH